MTLSRSSAALVLVALCCGQWLKWKFERITRDWHKALREEGVPHPDDIGEALAAAVAEQQDQPPDDFRLGPAASGLAAESELESSDWSDSSSSSSEDSSLEYEQSDDDDDAGDAGDDDDRDAGDDDDRDGEAMFATQSVEEDNSAARCETATSLLTRYSTRCTKVLCVCVTHVTLLFQASACAVCVQHSCGKA